MATEPNPANDNGGNNNNEPAKVTFTEQQQTRVNELIQDAMGRAGREAREKTAQLEQQLGTLRSELDQAKDAQKRASNNADKKEKAGDIAALEAQIAEMRNAHSQVQEESKRFRDAAEAQRKE